MTRSQEELDRAFVDSIDTPDFLYLRLLENGANPDARDSRGIPAIHRATFIDGRVEALIAAGADVHAMDYLGQTALHRAALRNNTNAVEALLEAGADPLVKNLEGQTPREAALARPSAINSLMRAEDERAQVLKNAQEVDWHDLFYGEDDNRNELYAAIEDKDITEGQQFIDYLAKQGQTLEPGLLMDAARLGKVDYVRELIPHTDMEKRGPLILLEAAKGGHVECVKELLPHSNIQKFMSDWVSTTAIFDDDFKREDVWQAYEVKADMRHFIEAWVEGQQLRANLPSVADEMQGHARTQSRSRRL